MFNFTVFKSVMEVSDIDEGTYSFVLRAVLLYIKRTFGIDLDTYTDVPLDLQYAIFQHAKYLFDYQKKSISTVGIVMDSNGNRVTHRAVPPTASIYVYKEYSVDPIAFI
jgi:hypothetical protein